MRRKDGSPLGQLPPIPVRIASVLPAGQIEPHALGIGTLPWLGGYQLALIAGGVLAAMKGVHPYEELSQVRPPFETSAVIPLKVPGLDAQRHLVLIRRKPV